jgi:hypothetical protein
MNSVNNFSAVILIFLFAPLITLGQIDTRKPLECYLNNQPIRENKIRSLTIYADFNENGINAHGGSGGKLAEIEFDINGNQTYKLTSNNSGNLPFIEYGRGSTIVIDSSDLDGRKLSTYFENHQYTQKVLKEYDQDGNVLSETTIMDNDTVLKIGFTWSEAKMLRAAVMYSNSANKNTINEFNTDGRLSKHTSGNLKQEYTYENSGEILVTTVRTYTKDSLLFTEVYSTHKLIDQVTHYLRKNYSGEMEMELKAQYDKFGNAVSYFLEDRRDKSREEVLEPLRVTIENKYNSQNLLIKRLYYNALPESNVNVLTRVESYFYDTEPLPFKLQMGAFTTLKMMEGNYGDR